MMRKFYPEKPQIELMQTFPHRAWYRICDRAQVLNLCRSLPHQGRTHVNEYHRTMRYDDLEAVANLGASREEKERLCQIANKLARQTMRGGFSAHWRLPLEGVSYAGICFDEASEANDADLFNLSAFPCVMPHPSVANYPTIDLSELKAMAQELADLFDLPFPGACEKQGRKMPPDSL